MFTAKYSATTPLNSLRPNPGNVAISVDAGEDGPTSTTGWYNGFKIPGGGYLVIQSTSGNDPDYYPCAGDNELINLAKYTFGQSSISQVRDALYYFLGNSNVFVLDRIPNNVVTADGYLNIDMSVLGSFPSTGDAVLDLTGNQSIGRVNNGPSYRPDQGILDFDGVDDNISYSSPLCAGLDAWSWQSTVSFNAIQTNAASPYYQLYIEEFAIWIAQYANAVGIDMRQNGASWFDGNGGTNTGAQIGLGNIELNQYNHFTWTLEQPGIIKGYFNGQEEVAIPTNQDGPIATGNQPTFIGSRYGSQFFNGEMRDTKTYASTLTPDQVLQNFFLGPIVTNNLVFAMDPGNLVSYNPGDTTTYSLRPSNIKQNNNAGTLVNGVGFSKDGGGSFRFDGTNDYISVPNSLTVTQPYTILMWLKPDELGTGASSANRSTPLKGNGQWNPGIWVTQDMIRSHGNNRYVDSYIDWSDLEYAQIGMIFDGTTVYNIFNGKILPNFNSVAYSPGIPTQILIGAEGTGGASTNWDGSISNTVYYQRVLTEEELIQNFEAYRNRFGL